MLWQKPLSIHVLWQKPSSILVLWQKPSSIHVPWQKPLSIHVVLWQKHLSIHVGFGNGTVDHLELVINEIFTPFLSHSLFCWCWETPSLAHEICNYRSKLQDLNR